MKAGRREQVRSADAGHRKTKKPATTRTKTAERIANPRWPRTVIVVADSGEARILQALRGGVADGRRRAIVLEEIARLDNPKARQPARELVTDRTGRVFDSGSRTGTGPRSRARHGAQSDYDPHDVEVERFAKQLARRLDAERRRIGIEELIVIAGPRFLGELRQQLQAPTRKIVTREVDRDLVHADDRLIRREAFPSASSRQGR
jgi:protein required for attachment to host cells